jgi:hypothetical protein
MNFTSGVFDFPSHHGSGPQSQRLRVGFDHRIGAASAVLTGYSAAFTSGDHEFGRLVVELDTRIVNNSTTGPEVEVVATFGLRDFSNHWDDPYAGQVRFVLMTEPERRLPVVFDAAAVDTKFVES